MFERIRNQRRKLQPIRFVPVAQAFAPQVEVRFAQDVTGWVDRGRKQRYHFNGGCSYRIDEQLAVEFITKGYCQGELPRAVSDDERDDIRSAITTIGMGG